MLTIEQITYKTSTTPGILFNVLNCIQVAFTN
jgi:hypothetical protein